MLIQLAQAYEMRQQFLEIVGQIGTFVSQNLLKIQENLE